MAKTESCHNCVYSYCDPCQMLVGMGMGWPSGPVCANHPDSVGRMRPTPAGRVCRNYRPRPETPEGEVKQIPLGDGFYAYVDAADFEWLNQWQWHLYGGYAGRYEKTKFVLMHRQIRKPPKGMIVDHKNRNKLDNTRANLRVCTHSENAHNRTKRRGSSSRLLGVSVMKDQAKYHAYVHHNGRHLRCGDFTDEIEAARAHDCKAVEVYGEFARLNFPDEWPPERRAQVYALRHAESVERKRKAKKAAAKGKSDVKRKTNSKRPTGRRSRATASKKPRAEPQGRRETDQSKKVRRSEGKRATTPREAECRTGKRVGGGGL